MAVRFERILVEIVRVWARLSAFSSNPRSKAVQNDHFLSQSRPAEEADRDVEQLAVVVGPLHHRHREVEGQRQRTEGRDAEADAGADRDAIVADRDIALDRAVIDEERPADLVVGQDGDLVLDAC